MLRMTANHPSVLAARSTTAASFEEIDKVSAENSLNVGAGVSSIGYAGQPGNQSTLISPHITASKVLYDHGRSDLKIEGSQSSYQAQKAYTRAVQENINK